MSLLSPGSGWGRCEGAQSRQPAAGTLVPALLSCCCYTKNNSQRWGTLPSIRHVHGHGGGAPLTDTSHPVPQPRGSLSLLLSNSGLFACANG